MSKEKLSEDQKNPLNSLVSCFPAFQRVFEEIAEPLDLECSYWRIVGFVDKPEGQKQGCDHHDCFDHEYVDQSGSGPCGDDFSGFIYLPMGAQYLKIEYYS